jgi:hypothetical protein
MKIHLFFLICVISCLSAFFGCAGQHAADSGGWRVLQQNSYGDTFSYNTGSVKHTENGTTTVLAKASGAIYLYEIDCKNKKGRLIEGTSTTAPGWSDITSGTDELLYNAVCP